MIGAQLPITLTEDQITYFATPHIREFDPRRFPVYGFIDADDLLYYDFPVYGEVATEAGIDGAGPSSPPSHNRHQPGHRVRFTARCDRGNGARLPRDLPPRQNLAPARRRMEHGVRVGAGPAADPPTIPAECAQAVGQFAAPTTRA
jgi:hypothetical protein